MLLLNKKLLTLTAALVAITLPISAEQPESAARIVDFAKCYTDSKYGKKEQENLEMMKSQMEKAMRELNDQLTETSAKLNDEHVLDSLSPEAEKELKDKLEVLTGEMQRGQQQFYYMMQQANMKTMNTIAEKIKAASKELAKKNDYKLIINKDQVFFLSDNLEITEDMITHMDSMYEKEIIKKKEVEKQLSSNKEVKSQK